MFKLPRSLQMYTTPLQVKQHRQCTSYTAEKRSCNHCCCGTAMSITQPVCIVTALGIWHAMDMYYIVICGLPRSMFFYIISETA